MLRLSFSAALAALAVPVVLSASAAADPGGAGNGQGNDQGSDSDPSVQTQLRKQSHQATPRREQVSRRAKRGARPETDTPLEVTIDQLTPSTIPEKGLVRVSGTVTNNDTATWLLINTYAFISEEPMTSSAQLEAAAKTPPDAFVGGRITEPGHYDTIPELAPGDSAPFSFNVSRQLLHADSPGVYWFGVHALGEGPEGRDTNADGRARTFLPLVPPGRDGDLPTSVVIPLRHQLVYTAEGSVDDLAGWTQSLSSGGRLRSLVDFGASSGDRTVTWVVDPGLVDAVRRLAAGNPPRSLAANLRAGQDDGEEDGEGSESPSATDEPSESPSPTADDDSTESPLDLDELDPVVQAAAQAAQAWLARLGEAMRPEDAVMTLPYGDVDVAAAARSDSQLYQRAVTRSETALGGFDVTAKPVVASPSGFLDTEGLRAVQDGSTVLLTDAMFEAPAPPVAITEGHQVVVTSTGAAAGGPGPDDRTGITAMRQRLLSEAAVRFLHRDRAPLTMVIPHDWNPTAGGAPFFGGLDVDWLDLTSVDAVARAAKAEPVAGDTLRYPNQQEAAELDDASFDAADALIRSGVALQSLLTLNNKISGTVTDQALGSTSYSSRTRPINNRASADRSRQWIDDRLGQVHVSAPRAVTLSSSSGQFGAAITNGLDQPVTVSLEAKSDDRLHLTVPAQVDVPANGKVSVLLTARTGENGIHDVTLVVTDKRGVPLGASTSLSIRSAQVSNVIWLIVAIGAALLFGAIGLRLFRRIRDARRTPAESDDTDDPDDPDSARQGTAEPDKLPAEAGSR
jgi:Family of unknown function (DUF6049)